MPIEIRELIIRTHITDGDRVKHTDNNHLKTMEREIINKCVDKILRKLKKKQDR